MPVALNSAVNVTHADKTAKAIIKHAQFRV